MSKSDFEIAFERERKARVRAERVIEEKNRDIYHLRKDLSEARETVEDQEANLVQADKLKSVGQLASGITHEINNPLAFITSNVNELERIYDRLLNGATEDRDEIVRELELLKEDIPEIFSEVKEGLSRIGKIVANVKRFARKNAEEKELSDVNREILATYKMVEKQLNPNTRVDLNLSELPLVICNIGEIGQVFVNLLINADQAMGSDGGRIEVQSSVEGKCVVVTVSDNGPGIPPEALESIFDPFFTTKPVGEGTGLGLSVSYGIIEAHGGNITVSSEVGEGTSFTIVLPIDS